jgi:predicted nucleic acid-binding protein
VPDAITNTSPLVYLFRIEALNWLPSLFGEVWAPGPVLSELEEGRQKGYDVPDLRSYDWVRIVEPRSMPSEWLALDLGPGELAAMALALENRERIILLDDGLARRTAQAAGLEVWGTLKVMLEATSQGLVEDVAAIIDQLADAGLWFSIEIRQRVLALARAKENGRPLDDPDSR